MIERIEKVYQWLSPICLCVAGAMVYAGFGPFDSVVQDWTAVVFWGICGGFSASGLIFALLALYTAQRHVRVVRTRILQHRRQFTLRDQTAGRYTHLLIP